MIPEVATRFITYLAFFLTALSLINYAERWSLLIGTGFVILSIFLDRSRKYPPRLLLNVISVFILFFGLLSVRLNTVVDQGIKVSFLLTGIKFLEEKMFRDYLQIYVLLIILLASKAIISLDVTFLFQLLSIFFMLTLSAVFLNFQREECRILLNPKLFGRICFSSFLIFLFSIISSFPLFMVLPRTYYPIFESLNGPRMARTGIKDHITLGSYSDIYEDGSIAFRVKMEKLDEEPYWRGCALVYFDGKKWEREKKSELEIFPYKGGRLLSQEIFIEGEKPPFLFALDKPVAIYTENMRPFNGDSSQYGKTPLRYEAISELKEAIEERCVEKLRYLQIPKEAREKLKGIAEKITSGAKTDREKIRRIYDFLVHGAYTYSISDLPKGEDAIYKFLFETKKGNCEIFSSAFALLLRTSGIPARIVVGFKGGDYNHIGKYYIIRQLNSHAWVEVYTEESGWVRFDPTPSQGESSFREKGKRLFWRLSTLADTINYYWMIFVINYDLERQISIISSLHSSLEKKRKSLNIRPKSLFFPSLFVLMFALSVFFLRKIHHLIRTSEEEKVLKTFLGKLKRMGYQMRKGDGLEELSRKIECETTREKVFLFVKKFEEVLYKDKRLSKEEKEMLKRMVEEI